ncbi:major facilitator superfamily domain-containing protein 8-like [Montipora capricornis]|uniref:major facilitator superfamily domain-containing protein 8-like n=1 Tax=Montipora capricornis TaxID=246305 RepID=UPI0035F20F45
MALSKTNIAVVLLIGFVNYLEWAVVLTSIYPYILSLCKDTSSSSVYLSLAQSLFPLGQGISQPVASVMVKKLRRIKIVLISSIIIAICGNVTYIAASEVDSVALIILGRALAGLGAGSGGVAYGFIGANTSREHRTKFMSYFRVTCMAGVMTSTIASATFLPNFGKNILGKATRLDEFSAPAALTILFLCICLVLVTFVLDEKDCVPIGGSNDGESVRRSLMSRGVLLGLMLYLLNGFVTTWVGFVLPLVAYNHFDFNLHQYGWLMVGVSGTATISAFTVALVSKARCVAGNKHSDWRVLVFSYTFMVTAIVISYLGSPSVSLPAATKEPLFITGVMMVFLTYSVSGVILPSLTTKYVAKSMMPVIMPYCIAAMSAGKVVAPLLSKAELAIQGWELLFMGSAGITLVGFLLFLCLYRAPEPEETPLLQDRRHAGSVEESPILASLEQGLMNPQGKRMAEVSVYFDRSDEEYRRGTQKAFQS